MDTNSHIREELFVDYAEGNLSNFEKNEIYMHIRTCQSCREKLNKWIETLDTRKIESINAPDLKETLWNKLEKKRKRRELFKKPKFLFGAGSLAAAVIFVFSLVMLTKNEDPVNFAHYEENRFVTLVNKPDTQQINIMPVSSYENIEGNIWVNHVTHEMFLEMNGFPLLNNHDYQLWIIYQNDEIEGTIIPVSNGTSKMYMKDVDVNNFKLIKGSVEPKGGSHIPTGPPAFIVEIRR